MTIGKPERATQDRVVALLRDALGYRYLGDWSTRVANSNIEETYLTVFLTRSGYTSTTRVARWPGRPTHGRCS